MNRRVISRVPMVMALAFVTVLLLPAVVSAETTQEVTTIVSIGSYNSSADEQVNLANETSRWNRDTWTYLPSGIFVGGTIEESSFRLNEMFTADGYLLMGTVIQFQDTYVASGASLFTLRLPWLVNTDYVNSSGISVSLTIVRMDTPTDYSIEWTYDAGYWFPSVNTADGTVLVRMGDIGGMLFDGVPNTNPLNDSWVSDNRLYARIYAPLISEQYYYLFLTTVCLKASSFAEVYLHPSDLASDNVTSSRIEVFWPVPGSTHYESYNIAVDLGYSFVFEESIGEMATSYDGYFNAGQKLVMTRWLRSPTFYLNGSFNLIMEFATEDDSPLIADISVTHKGTGADIICLDSGYWNNMLFRQYIVASNPQNVSYQAKPWTVEGYWWHEFEITITFAAETHLQFLMFADPLAPLDGDYQIMHYTDADTWQRFFFSPWLTCSVDPYTWNKTYVPSLPDNGQGASFQYPDRDFFLAHWLDEIGGILWDLGEKVAVSPYIPGGKVIGAILMSAAVVSWLYADLNEFLWDLPGIAANWAIKNLLDGLSKIGNWIYNIGMKIWKALTWLVDQLFYYGSIVLAMLIYGLAVLVPIGMILLTIKVMSILLKIAKADLEGAAAEVKETVGLPGVG